MNNFVHVEFSELKELSDNLAGVMVFDDDNIYAESLDVAKEHSISLVYSDDEGVARISNMSEHHIFFWLVNRSDVEETDDNNDIKYVFDESQYHQQRRLLRADKDIVVHCDSDKKLVIRKI